MNVLSNKAVKYIYSNGVELNQAGAIGVASVILENYLDECAVVGYQGSIEDLAEWMAGKYRDAPHDEFQPGGYSALDNLDEDDE